MVVGFVLLVGACYPDPMGRVRVAVDSEGCPTLHSYGGVYLLNWNAGTESLDVLLPLHPTVRKDPILPDPILHLGTLVSDQGELKLQTPSGMQTITLGNITPVTHANITQMFEIKNCAHRTIASLESTDQVIADEILTHHVLTIFAKNTPKKWKITSVNKDQWEFTPLIRQNVKKPQQSLNTQQLPQEIRSSTTEKITLKRNPSRIEWTIIVKTSDYPVDLRFIPYFILIKDKRLKNFQSLLALYPPCATPR